MEKAKTLGKEVSRHNVLDKVDAALVRTPSGSKVELGEDRRRPPRDQTG